MAKVKTLSETKKMTNKDLLTLSQGLAYINSKETKVWHTISQNLDVISPLVATLNQEHAKISKELAVKDEMGNPKRTEQNQIDFGENIEKANTRWEKILEQEVEITLVPIQLSDIKAYDFDANIMKPLLGTLVVE